MLVGRRWLPSFFALASFSFRGGDSSGPGECVAEMNSKKLGATAWESGIFALRLLSAVVDSAGAGLQNTRQWVRCDVVRTVYFQGEESVFSKYLGRLIYVIGVDVVACGWL